MNSRAEPLAHTNDDYAGPTKPLTLAIDIGGSHLKAAVLNASGKISTGPLRVETPKPAAPDAVVAALVSLSQQLGQFDRVSIGFPGVVRADFVLTAPNLGTKEWHGFRLGAVMHPHQDATSGAIHRLKPEYALTFNSPDGDAR